MNIALADTYSSFTSPTDSSEEAFFWGGPSTGNVVECLPERREEMSRMLAFTALASLAGSSLRAERSPYNEHHGPFEPDKWPPVVKLEPCEMSTGPGGWIAGFTIIARHAPKNDPEAPRILLARKSGWRWTWLLVSAADGRLLTGPKPFLGQAGAGSRIQHADLNGDGKQDFVIRTLLGGCGTIYTFSCNLTFVLSTGDTYDVTSTDGLWSSPDYFVDVNGDGVCEAIHTRFVEGHGETARDGKSHNYWVYNLLELKTGKAALRNDLVPGFPKWIWYTYEPNHQATTMITEAQKKRLWKKFEDPIFWKPSSGPIVETLWQESRPRTSNPLILVFDPKRRESDYEAPAHSSLPLDDPYVVERGADRGLIRVHTDSGEPQKRYIVPREEIRAVVCLYLGACITENYEYVFTRDKIVIVYRSIANAGIFDGSDIWEIPGQRSAGEYDAILKKYDRVDRDLFRIALDFDTRPAVHRAPDPERGASTGVNPRAPSPK